MHSQEIHCLNLDSKENYPNLPIKGKDNSKYKPIFKSILAGKAQKVHLNQPKINNNPLIINSSLFPGTFVLLTVPHK